MTWRTDPRPENTRRFGDLTLVSETHKRTRETAHLITFPDGQQIRVLPDDRSGQRRSRLVREALEALDALVSRDGSLVDPEFQRTYLLGLLTTNEVLFERIGNVREQTLEEWLSWWFFESDADQNPTCFLADLEDAGWTLRRRSE